MKKSTRYIDIAAALVIYFLAGSVHFSDGNQTGRHTYVVRYKHGESLIPVTVVLDYKRQTEYVINMNSRTPTKSVTLYDFKEKVIAYKDLKNGECFIGRLTHETIQEEDEALKRLKNPLEGKPLILTLEPDRPSMTPTEVRNMAGHKAAVFCRHMNTWPLIFNKDNNKREKRDTPIFSDFADPDTNLEAKYIFRQGSSNVNKLKNHSNNSQQGISVMPGDGFYFNTEQQTSVATRRYLPGRISALNANSEHLGLNNIYPFILPKQNTFGTNPEDRILRQNPSIHNATRRIVSDNTHHFSHGRSHAQTLLKKTQLWSPDNGKNVSFILPPANQPVIIPSVSFRNDVSKKKFGLEYDSSSANVPNRNSGLYSLNVNTFQTFHNRGDALNKYPSFEQLPPEAFILPLTRSPTITPANSNRLGYNFVSSDALIAKSKTTFSNKQLDKSLVVIDDVKLASEVRPFPNEALHHQEISSADVKVPSSSNLTQNNKESQFSNGLIEKEGYPLDRTRIISSQNSANETEDGGKERPSNILRFTKTNSKNDSENPVSRWYPEITKQISIPLEIEVLHHREEYPIDLSNKTEQVHPIRAHKSWLHKSADAHSPNPTTHSSYPITHSFGPNSDTPLLDLVKSRDEVKLLPQVNDVPKADITPNRALNEVYSSERENFGRKYQTEEFRENNHTIYKDILNVKTTAITFLANVTDRRTPVNRSEIGALSSRHSGRRSRNHISYPISSLHERIQEDRHNNKREQVRNERTHAVQGLKIDEGFPSYRKRFPIISPSFTSDETNVDVNRSRSRYFRPIQQIRQKGRRSQSVRNGTHTMPTHITPLRRNNINSRDFVNRQQQGKLNNQGITFHHRGYGSAGVPDLQYDHNRKRLGLLPPGVSVHPRHPQAPYADLAVDKPMPIPSNIFPQSSTRRIHLRHHRRHQRKGNRIAMDSDSGLAASNCCGSDNPDCCSGRGRGRHLPKPGCCDQRLVSRRSNSLLSTQALDTAESRKENKVADIAEDRCTKEKMCRTVYQSAKKVLVCRNVPVEGC